MRYARALLLAVFVALGVSGCVYEPYPYEAPYGSSAPYSYYAPGYSPYYAYGPPVAGSVDLFFGRSWGHDGGGRHWDHGGGGHWH